MRELYGSLSTPVSAEAASLPDQGPTSHTEEASDGNALLDEDDTVLLQELLAGQTSPSSAKTEAPSASSVSVEDSFTELMAGPGEQLHSSSCKLRYAATAVNEVNVISSLDRLDPDTLLRKPPSATSAGSGKPAIKAATLYNELELGDGDLFLRGLVADRVIMNEGTRLAVQPKERAGARLASASVPSIMISTSARLTSNAPGSRQLHADLDEMEAFLSRF
jgi:hypothetical protein